MSHQTFSRACAAAAAVIATALAPQAFAQSTLDAPRQGATAVPHTQADRLEQRVEQREGEVGAPAFDRLAAQYPDLSKFAAAVKAGGLAGSLTDGSEYTIFAPTNEALEDKGGKDLDKLMQPQNRDELVSFLHAHIVAEPIDLQSPRRVPETKTMDGETLAIDRDESGGTIGAVKIDDAKVVNTSGISIGQLKIYPIDEVLVRNGKKS
jgi:uncharacterized surface protein with fasciclin (FAS1) repeats